MKLQQLALLFSAITLADASVKGPTTNQLEGCPQKRVGMSLYRRGGSFSRPQLTEPLVNPQTELFNIPEDSGPLPTVASYLNPSELWSFLRLNKNLRLSSLFYKTQSIRIPADATDDAVLKMLPSLKKFETIIIGLNHDHLSFLQENCPQLRHLIVHSELKAIPWRELKPFMDSLKTFTGLTSLKIDIPQFFKITLLEDLGLPNYTILPVMIPDILTNEALRQLLPSLQRFEAISIGLNRGHLEILKECTNLRHLSVIQKAADTQIGETIPLIIGHLSSFNKLKSLKISKYQNDLVVDLAPLKNLTELTELGLNEFDSPDLSFVSRLKKFKKLTIMFAGSLRKFDHIAGLTQLEDLDLLWSRESGSDYASILPRMKTLKRLNLRGAGLKYVSFLRDMVQLDRLDISHCEVSDISSLSGLPIYADKQKLIWNDSYGPGHLDPRTL
jgi:hypothetical protein